MRERVSLAQRIGTATALTAGIIGGSLGLSPSAQIVQPPVFRSGTDLVQVDVTALGASGRPVSGLQADDFIVLDQGRRATIDAVSEIRLPGPDRRAEWMRIAGSDVSTNSAIAEKRVVLMIIDDRVLSSVNHVRQDVQQFVRDVIEQLGPQDLAAIVFTATNWTAQDWTQDRQLLFDAVDNHRQEWGFENTPPVLTVYSVDVVSRAARQLIGIPTRRKVLIYIGPPQSVSINPAGRSKYLGRRDEWGMAGRVDAIIRDAQKAGISIFTASAPGSLPPANSTRQYHRDLAAATGGFALSARASDARDQIARIFEETGHYYTLGFRAVENARSGFRSLQVHTRRAGVTIRAPAGYYPPRLVAAEAAQRKEPRAEERGSASSRALAGILPATDIPLELSLAGFGAAPIAGSGLGHVAVMLHINDPTLAKDTVQAPVDFEVRVYDGEGVREVAYHSVALSGVVAPEHRLAFALKPGRYNVRVAVHDRSSGRSGSVYGTASVPAPGPRGVLVSSAFVLEPVGAGTLTLTAWPEALPPATVQRHFKTTEGIRAGVRVNHGRNASLVQVRTEILDGRDRVVRSEVQQLPNDGSGAGWADLLTTIDRGSLTPGPYLLRFTILVATQTPVVRQVRFWVRE